MSEVLGELEEKLMNILWSSDRPLKPSEVQEMAGNTHAYTTIMTVLTRLYEKGILKRKKKGKAYYYHPDTKKEQFATPRLKKLFERIINSYGEIAVSQFMDVLETLDAEEINKLRSRLKNAK
jgi:predicted transcriptional regulator